MNNISRRNFMKSWAIALTTIAMTGQGVFSNAQEGSSVYLSKNISPTGLTKIYTHLMQGRTLSGKVAVKLHSGEPGGHNYPNPSLIKNLVQLVDGTIVECNTAYKGKRFNTVEHMKALRNHGFTDIAPVDIMDEKGSITLPYPKVY